MKVIFLAPVVVALTLAGTFAQQQAQPPAQSPSLEITMKFIQEKLKAKVTRFTDITADPTTCQLTLSYHSAGGNVKSHDSSESFSFREVENIRVMSQADFNQLKGWDEPDSDTASRFILQVLTTTEKSVHYHLENTYKHGKPSLRDSYRGEWVGALPDEDTANRLANAMLHAAELCGAGQKEEPF